MNSSQSEYVIATKINCKLIEKSCENSRTPKKITDQWYHYSTNVREFCTGIYRSSMKILFILHKFDNYIPLAFVRTYIPK